MAFTAEYLAAKSFRILDNHVSEFMYGRRIKAYCGMDGYRFGTVETSGFSNPYTIVNLTANSEDITASLETIEYGIIGFGINQSMPIHDHDNTDGFSGGLLDSNLKSATPHGFVNRTDSLLSYDSTNHSIIVEPVSTSFDVFVKGKKFTYTTPQVLSIPNVTGLYGVVVDINGVFQISLNVSLTYFILNNASVAFAYWNSTSGELITFADERHGTGMSGITHYYLHRVFRTRWLQGLVIENILEDQAGDNDAHAQLSVSNGEFADEDLIFGVTNNVPQALAPIAYIPVFYKSGATGIWNKSVTTSFPVKTHSGTGLLAANQFTGGVWAQTPVSSDSYVLAHIYAFNHYEGRIIAIQGQVTYSSIADARAGAESEIASLNLSGMPLAEMLPLGSVIYQTSTTFTNSIKAKICSTDTGNTYIDWRFTPYTSLGNSNWHGYLSGLSYDDHPQYILENGSRAFMNPVGGIDPTQD